MSDAFWISLGGSLIALTGLLNCVFSFLSSRRAQRAIRIANVIDAKTDVQTRVILEAKDAAQAAADHANGSLKRVEEQLERAHQARVDDLKESRDQAVEALAGSAPAPTAAAAPPATRIEVQVVPPTSTPRPARASDTKPDPPTS